MIAGFIWVAKIKMAMVNFGIGKIKNKQEHIFTAHQYIWVNDLR